MASYPGPKVHRVNRRKLGKGQYPTPAPVSVVVTDAGSTATLTFSSAVVVTGTIGLNVSGGLTLTSQTQTSANVVQQVYSAALSAKTWSIPANAPNVQSTFGGKLAPASGTFS